MKYLKLIILVSILIFIGNCNRQLESENLGYDLPDEPPVPISLSVVHLADGVSLSWQVSDTVSGMAFNVYYSDAMDGEYNLWEKTNVFLSSITALTSGLTYFLKVSSVTADGLEGLSSQAVETSIGIVSIVINQGNEYTNSRNVSIGFVVPRPISLLQLSEDQTFADAFWQNYSPSVSFQLSPAEGEKQVFARLRFNDGSETDSISAISDNIRLDMQASIDSVYFLPNDIVFSSGSSVTFYVATSEPDGSANVTFPGLNQLILPYDENLSDTDNNFHVYSRSFIIPNNLEVVDGPVAGRFTDGAGNNATSVISELLINIANDPTPVTLTAIAESSSSIRLNWSESIDSDFSAYHIYRGTNSSVSNDSEPVAVISNRSTTVFNDDGLDENSRYYYNAYVYDNTGRFVASNVTDATTLDNPSPTGVVLAGRIELRDTDSVVVLSWTPYDEDDFGSYRVYRTGDTTASMSEWSLLEIINSRNSTQFTDLTPTATAEFYKVIVFDEQGKWAESNWVEMIL